MDVDDTPEEASFRAEARAWLEVSAPAPSAARPDEDVPFRELARAAR